MIWRGETVAVLGTGPSMSAAVAESVRGRCRVIAVNGTFRLAPWADALAAQDLTWWAEHPDAAAFAGLKFSANAVPGAQRVPGTHTGLNSGCLAVAAAAHLGAARVLLLGCDNGGGHYFGDYAGPLLNAPIERYAVFQVQFYELRDQHPQLEIVNCTPGSLLRGFRHADLEAELCARSSA